LPRRLVAAEVEVLRRAVEVGANTSTTIWLSAGTLAMIGTVTAIGAVEVVFGTLNVTR